MAYRTPVFHTYLEQLAVKLGGRIQSQKELARKDLFRLKEEVSRFLLFAGYNLFFEYDSKHTSIEKEHHSPQYTPFASRTISHKQIFKRSNSLVYLHYCICDQRDKIDFEDVYNSESDRKTYLGDHDFFVIYHSTDQKVKQRIWLCKLIPYRRFVITNDNWLYHTVSWWCDFRKSYRPKEYDPSKELLDTIRT